MLGHDRKIGKRFDATLPYPVSVNPADLVR